MKFKLILAAVALLFAVSSKAQTTVNFTGCAGQPTSPYQGIDFSSSPFWCEKVWLSANPTLSFSQNIQSAQFKFVSASVLNSIDVGDVGSGGMLTIATDKAEMFSIQVPASKMLTGIQTGFKLPATVITLTYSDSWFLELGKISYTPQTTQPPGILGKLTLTYDDGSAFVGKAQVVSIGTLNGVTTNFLVVQQTFDNGGNVSAFLTVGTGQQIDPALNYQIFILDPNPPTAGVCPTNETLVSVVTGSTTTQECAVFSSPVVINGVLVTGLKSASLAAKVQKSSGQIVSENYAVQ